VVHNEQDSHIHLTLWYYRLTRSAKNHTLEKTIALAVALHPGFLILDSIHFQYNAFLFGLMLWSLVGAREQKPVMCAAFFATLLMFK
jgi:alpha-1,3-glucosyltransferase